jgi:hypothetical protein
MSTAKRRYPSWICSDEHEEYLRRWLRRHSGVKGQEKYMREFEAALSGAPEWSARCQREYDEFCHARGYSWDGRRGFAIATLHAGRRLATGDGDCGPIPRCFDHIIHFWFTDRRPRWPAAILSFPYCKPEEGREYAAAAGFNCEVLPYQWYGSSMVKTSCFLLTPANGYAFDQRSNVSKHRPSAVIGHHR